MDTSPPDRRVFGDKDIGKILKRASELQRASPVRPDPSGLSLVELEEIALEAGIDVENVRRAVTELDTGGDSRLGDLFLGAPTKLLYEHVLPGELDNDDFGRMIPVLHTSLGAAGQPNVVGRTLTWQATMPNTNRTIRLFVMSQDGETSIRIEEHTGQLAGGLMGGIGSGSLGLGIPAALALGQAGGAGLGIVAGVGVVGGALLLARTIYKSVFRKRKGELSNLFQQLVRFVEETAKQTQDVAPYRTLDAPASAALPAPEPGPDQ